MNKNTAIKLLPALMLVPLSVSAQVTSFADAISAGEVNLDMRWRYEHVDQDNDLKDADASTIRTRLTLSTGEYRGLSGLLEFEDSREAFVDDYNDGLGSNPRYSTVADPETTELDQLYLRYKYEQFRATVGRQVLVRDNQRFIGHVGWRQDRQTFDAVELHWQASHNINVAYAYIDQRNRIFADDRDVDAQDHLFNADIGTDVGKLSGYVYLLEEDDSPNESETYGIRLAGDAEADKLTLRYAIEYAMQDADNANGSFDTDYYLFEGGVGWRGITITGGLEVLGSDGGDYGFSTPLATLHKFNGWADQFLSTPDQGIEDYYIGASGQVLKGTWNVVYHRFDADKSTRRIDDLGDEWDFSYAIKFYQHYAAGAKYAMYSEGDSEANKVDTDKFWIWLSANF
ncbi:alginate export family protein [Ferrimonas lipolytica]|uniref:Alginate export family protein n=1 Tax=Ferrimonas lipolytica TaxID=2724191 RepID=A0A6H1UAK7_9GAMM|nr:alginate export family protein [Ferrimonas lipolytica]QIZ76097.1 alginate export family protein [Ferrimonas lipolytica]